jgi:uncharacterized membrane protein YczE
MGDLMPQATILNPAGPGTRPQTTTASEDLRLLERTARELRRWTLLLSGLVVFAVGLTMMIRSDLGLSPWDVLHDAIRGLTPLTFGQVVVLLSLIVVGVAWTLGVRPGPATVVNSILVGVVTDVMLATGFLGGLSPGPLLPRLGILLAGISTIAVGTATYIAANLGAGPRDGLMLGVARRASRSTGGARTAIEATVLIGGVLLGGSIGPGTAVFLLAIGPAINVAFRLFGMEPARTKRPLAASLGSLRNDGVSDGKATK